MPGEPIPMPRMGAVVSNQPVDQGQHLGGGLFAAAAGEGDLGAREGAAVDVEDRAAEDGVLAEVDADDLSGAPVHVEKDSGLAGAYVVALTDLADEVLGDQPGDEVGDGDPGESGRPGEVGAAHLACTVEGLEHQGPVVVAGVLREDFGSGAQRTAGEHHPIHRNRTRVTQRRTPVPHPPACLFVKSTIKVLARDFSSERADSA